MRKTFFALTDSETNIDNTVSDLAILIVDRNGVIHNQLAVLVREFYLNRDDHPLFHDQTADPLWGKANLDRRYKAYDSMLSDGRRMLASVPAINRWIAKAVAKYNPIFTAYNAAFDLDKMNKSGIDTELFERKFCLWNVAAHKYAKTKAYRQFVLENVAFNKPTQHGNMSFHTNAEIMAKFILQNPDMADEPHTALEDARDYELPILKAVLKNTKTSELFDAPAYNWRNYQVKDWFRPK